MHAILKKIGLTDGEIAVYLALLEIGETTTGKIIDKAQISGGKIYHILERLIQKGLAGYIVKGKTKYFSATPPKRLLDMLNNEREKIDSQMQEVEHLLPTLTNMGKDTSYDVVLFKNYSGIKNAIYEILDKLKKDDVVQTMGIRTLRDEKYNIMWKHWHQERIKRKIKCQMIFEEGDDFWPKTIGNLPLTDVRIIKGITPASANISGDHVLLFTYHKEPGCLMIKHEDITSSFRTFFETLWTQSKKL